MFGYEQDTTAQLAPEIQFINNNFPQTRYWSHMGSEYVSREKNYPW